MDRLSIVLINERREIERLSEAVERFGEAHHLLADDVAAVNLVLDEIVINIIAHGYDDEQEHQIRVSLTLEGDLLTIQVEDDSKPFNPLDAALPNLDLPIDERPIGGLGIHIVRSTVDAVQYRREGGRNILRMRKTMTGREEA